MTGVTRMIRVRILRSTGAGALGVLGVGEIVSLPDDAARPLIAAGRAEAVLTDPTVGTGGEPTEPAAPMPRSADPKPRRSR